MSLYSPEDVVIDIPGYGGGYGGGGGRGGGGVVRLPGKPNIVPYNRFPKISPPRPPRLPRIEVPKFRPPRIPQVRFPRVPHPIIPSFPTAPSNPGLPSPDDKVEPIRNTRNIEVPTYQQLPISNPNNIAIPLLNPMGGGDVSFPTPVRLEVTIAYQLENIWLEWRDTESPVVKRFLGSPSSTTYIFDNATAIRKLVTVTSTNYDTDVQTYWQVRTGADNWNTLSYSGESWHIGQYNNPSASFWFSNGQVFDLYGSYHPDVKFRNLSISPPLNFPPPIRQVQPNRVRNPQEQDEDDRMPCERCRAEEVIWMLRSMRQNIPVNEVTIVPSPTNLGNWQTIDTTSIKTVFCLPGTQNAIRDQFNLMAELKKRLAKTFNQSRMAKVLARISQIMNFTQFWLTFHNALMMSADIGETFFGAIFQTLNNVAKLADDTPLGSFYDLDETPYDAQQLITSKLEEWAKQIFGVQNWSEIKGKFAALNQIIRSTNTMVMNMRDLGESQRDLAEMSAERVGKLNNSLRKAGVIFDEGNWMSEDVNMRSRFLEKLEKIEESGVINTAVFFQTLSQQALDVQETKKEVAESKQKFQEDLTKGISTISGQATDAKGASQGADITKDDIAK